MTSKIDNITKLPEIKGTPRMSQSDVNRSIHQYIANVVNSGKNPPHAGDMSHFFELVQNAIWSRQETEETPECKRLLVMVNDPPEEKEVDTEAITFYLQHREPGAFGKMSASSGRSTVVKEATHHHRSSQQHPEHIGEKLVTMGRFFDNTVVFNIYAASDNQAMKRLIWFENVIDSYSWYFSLHRIKIVELEASRIGKVVVGELPLAKYSVSYFVRTEDTYQFGSQELKKVVLKLDVSNNN
jgi:hypothetical protein